MNPFRRNAPATSEQQVRECIAEAFPDGPDEAKLCALICCVRRRCKGTGYRREVIASRSHVAEAKIHRIIGGDFTDVRWDAIEAVLKALDAVPVEITVAFELFQTIPDKPTAPPKEVVAVGTPQSDASPVVLTFGPDPLRHGGSTLPLPILELEQAEGQVRLPEPTHPERLADEATVPPTPDAPGPASDNVTREEPDQDSSPDPDPSKAQTTAAYVDAIKRYRIVKGEPSYRDMARFCADSPLSVSYSASSFNTIGKSGKLPKSALVRAFIVGCGGDEDDIDRWEKARASLALRLSQTAKDPG